MKIGILTFHSQLNYGGVLQCWALKTALEELGHTVQVLDRWLSPDNSMLEGPLGYRTLRQWLGWLIRTLAGCGTGSLLLRHYRTRRFVRSLNLTDYHFYMWNEAPKSLGVDCIVVGSDQVWHGGDWGFPDPYLLKGAPQIRAIAYAASFGMKSLSPAIDYAAGFRRFSAISVRESEGVPLVEETGYPHSVMHVVDPTLLIAPNAWQEFVLPNRRKRHLVCYFLAENISSLLPEIERWAQENDWTVKILGDYHGDVFPKSISALLHRVANIVSMKHFRSSAKFCRSYGPVEFVRSFARAEACVTDSFHAVMFSALFDCNVRFIVPSTCSRVRMFSRVQEFVKAVGTGPVFKKDTQSALNSLVTESRVVFNKDLLIRMRQNSLEWLKGALS